MINQHEFHSKKELYQSVTQFCIKKLERRLQQDGQASFIIPGGTTPAPVFELLSKTELNWKNITIAPSDERWLERDHDNSNEKLIRQTLLINQASSAHFTGMKSDHDTATQAQQQCSARYQQIPLPYEIIMLGMGPDGHFASLFPKSNPVQEALDIENEKSCIAIEATGCAVAGKFTERMSMTLSAILNSRQIILLFTGEEKLAIFEKAKSNNDSNRLPICALIHQNTVPVDLFWAR